MYEKIPNELKNLKHWCFYKLVWDEQRQKHTKLPFNAFTGQMAKSNDESTWSDYQTALSAIDLYGGTGLGFFFKPPYYGIDIDNSEGEVQRYLQGDIESNMIYEFIESMKSYAEYSQSGNGIHIIAKGKLPGTRRRKGDVEMYQTGRFFVMTGNSASEYDTINQPDDSTIKRLHRTYIGDDKVIEFKRNTDAPTIDLPINDIITKAISAKQGARFKVFLEGGWEAFYDSQSEADLAFANDLAFWTGRDFSKMDEIFRNSAMYREKYDEKRGPKTYGQALLDKAIHETQDIYNPSQKTDFKIYINDQIEKPKKENKFYSYDDTGNADRFCDVFGSLVRYSYINKAWYYYDGKTWLIDNTGEVRKMIDSTVELMKNEPIQFPEDMEEEAKEAIQKAWDKHVKRSRSNAGKNAMNDELKHRLSVLPDEFDIDKTLFNTQNGYLSFNLSVGNTMIGDMRRIARLSTDKEMVMRFIADGNTRLKMINAIAEGYIFQLEQPKKYYWRKKKEHLAWFEDVNYEYLNKSVGSNNLTLVDNEGSFSYKTKFTETEARDLLKDDFDKFEKVECE